MEQARSELGLGEFEKPCHLAFHLQLPLATRATLHHTHRIKDLDHFLHLLCVDFAARVAITRKEDLFTLLFRHREASLSQEGPELV